MKLKIIAALLFGTLDFCRADVLVNFNAPGDLGANFSGPAGGFLINETANEGLQNTRGANLANAGFSQIEVYNQQAYSGNLPGWKVGYFLFLVGNETQSFSLGLVNSTAAYVNGAYHSSYVQPSPDWNSIGISGDRFGNVTVYNNDQFIASQNIGVLADNSTGPSWFYVEATGGSSGGVFSLSASIRHADSLGNLGGEIGSILSISGIANSELANDSSTYFFFGADTGAGRALDNFQIQIVPEPSTLGMISISFAVLLVLGRRKP